MGPWSTRGHCGTETNACVSPMAACRPTHPERKKRIGLGIPLHVLRRAYTRDYDVARVFGQDQDLSEVAAEIRAVAEAHDRWIKIA